jgi:hypothetical protein
MTSIRPSIAASAIALGILGFVTWPVAADCELMGAVEDVLPTAQVAFVGTVASVEGPAAQFEVHEVWAGTIQPGVVVRGALDEPGPDAGFGAGFSEDDRHWDVGTTYLVLPYADGGTLRDNVCTATVAWTDDLADLRPADAEIYTGTDGPAATGSFSIPAPLIVAAAAVVGMGLVSLLAFRRRGEPPR